MHKASVLFPLVMPWLLLLGSCGSPPKPPTVDESKKRPVNTAMAVELQVCKNDLQNTRLLASESARLAETTAAALGHLQMRQQLLANKQAPASAQANIVHTVRFGFGSARMAMSADITSTVIEDAKAAPLVLLRGRTDGAADTATESRIARERADAVRSHLVGAGVDPARIRATYQPVGDHEVENATPAGRARNRRVEIEVYRALPVSATPAAGPLP
jgi:outer membrane protein OmpA-like peptidoglycan-associated protein